jgi:hypothetical protein
MTHETSNEIIRKELLTAVIAGHKDVARVEIRQIGLAPAQRTGLHTHPCPVVGYIASGTIRFQVAGEAEQLLSRGQRVLRAGGQESRSSTMRRRRRPQGSWPSTCSARTIESSSRC